MGVCSGQPLAKGKRPLGIPTVVDRVIQQAYYKYADILGLMKQIDQWYRRRLRMIIWKQWKKVKTKWRNLIKLGINKCKAWEYANTLKSY